MQNDASFPAMPAHPCMITRLIDEMREAGREFREDPQAYVKGALTANAGGGRRKNLLQLGFAIAILFYAVAFVSMLVFWSVAHQKPRAAQTSDTPRVMISLPGYWLKAEMPEGADRLTRRNGNKRL